MADTSQDWDTYIPKDYSIQQGPMNEKMYSQLQIFEGPSGYELDTDLSNLFTLNSSHFSNKKIVIDPDEFERDATEYFRLSNRLLLAAAKEDLDGGPSGSGRKIQFSQKSIRFYRSLIKNQPDLHFGAAKSDYESNVAAMKDKYKACLTEKSTSGSESQARKSEEG